MKTLTYIESTGTQYIDTGFKPNQNTRVVMNCEVLGFINSKDMFLYGARVASGNTGFYCAARADNASFAIGYANQSAVSSNLVGIANHTVDQNKNSYQIDSVSGSFTASTFQSSYNLHLFACITAGTVDATQVGKLKLYSCKIYDNGTLIRDFVPVELDETVGLWDKVNEVFYANAGTGSFIAGEELILTPTLSHTFTRLLNNAIYYGKVFVVNPKGRVNLRCDLASAFATPQGGILLGNMPEGTIIMIPEDGVDVPFYVAKHDYESGLNGTGRTLLVRKDCYDSRIIMDTNYGSGGALYTQSPLDAWANSDYKSLFDSTIQEAMATTKFYYSTSRSTTATIGTLERSVFILSLTELGLTYSYCWAEGSTLPIADTLRVAYLNGTATTQHTRTLGAMWANAFAGVTSSGTVQGVSANNTAGSRPCFTLPSTSMVSANADGTFTLLVGGSTNTPELEDTYLLNTTDKCTDITGGYTISYNYNNMRYSVSHNNGIQVYPNTNGDAGQIAIQTTKLINVTGFKKLLATLSSSGGTILNTSTVKLILCTTNTGNPINSAVKSIDFAWSNLTASAELDLTDVTGEYYVAIYWNYPKTLYDGYINTIQLLG